MFPPLGVRARQFTALYRASSRQFSTSFKSRAKYARFGDKRNLNEPETLWTKFQRLDRSSQLATVGIGGGAMYVASHIEKVEETGRWRFIDVSPSTEKQMSEESRKEVLREFGGKLLPPNHKLSRKVTEVASRIITAADLGHVKGAAASSQINAGFLPDWSSGETEWTPSTAAGSTKQRLKQEWEVFVINDDEIPNAFVTPGGQIFVFTGILPICKNDDGLATVLGHEIAHQVVRHSAERLSVARMVMGLAFILEVLGLDFGMARAGLTLAMTLPNSRRQESEADSVGLKLMAQACYDPREAPGIWQRMTEKENSSGSVLRWISSHDFVSTHPSSAKRMRELESLTPEALATRAASPACSGVSNEYDLFRRFTL